MAWEKDHPRLDRRRLKRVRVTPEEIGLCGCWQVIAVRRERVELGRKAKPPSDEIGYYVTSLGAAQLRDAELLQAIRDPLERPRERRAPAARRELWGGRQRRVAAGRGPSAGGAAQPGAGRL